MSDDTPTERFDAPTRPLPDSGADATPGTAAEGAVTTSTERRGILIAVIAAGGAIVLALIVLIIVLLSTTGGEPEAVPQPTPTLTVSKTPTPEPTVTESEEPEPEPTETTGPPPSGPTFATFSGTDRADCPDTSSAVTITWSWSSADAVAAWFGIGTNNAKAEPFESVPTTATYMFSYQCSEASQRYTVTLEDSAGRLAHTTVEIVRD